MRRIILALLLNGLSVAPGVMAGEYSAAVAKQSRCEAAGSLSMSFFGSTVEHLRAAANDVQKKVKAKEITKKLGAETQYIFWIGHSAKSIKDAYMQAWAWCMDQK